MNKDRYIVIQEWMLSLELNLNELIAYALIYGFCQDRDSDFHGSIDYVAYWCRVGRRQAIRILNALVTKGVVSKEDVPGHVSRYRVTHLPPVTDMPPVTSMSPLGCHSALEGVTSMSPNNKIDIPEDNIKTHSSPRTREDGKVLFGEFVRLTPAEHDKLVAEYGADDTARMIEILDVWLADQKKDPYKSHYIAIKKWCYRALQEQKTAELERQTAEQRLKNAQEAAQRAAAAKPQQGPPPGNYAALADANRRFKEITDKYKN